MFPVSWYPSSELWLKYLLSVTDDRSVILFKNDVFRLIPFYFTKKSSQIQVIQIIFFSSGRKKFAENKIFENSSHENVIDRYQHLGTGKFLPILGRHPARIKPVKIGKWPIYTVRKDKSHNNTLYDVIVRCHTIKQYDHTVRSYIIHDHTIVIIQKWS